MQSMHPYSIPTSDSSPLSFLSSLHLPPTPPTNTTNTTPPYTHLLILIHGFAGSSLYFRHNTPTLSSQVWTITPDLRGHGSSGRSSGGYHVARLASDIHDLIRYLQGLVPGVKIVGVGCSLGAAVWWTCVELFGDGAGKGGSKGDGKGIGGGLVGLGFVDQGPMQNRVSRQLGNGNGDGDGDGDEWGVEMAHKSCYDSETLRVAQGIWMGNPERAYRELVGGCLGYRFAPLDGDHVSEEQKARDEAFFMGEARRCDTGWLAKLMGDHTAYDHREACEGIGVPVMVMVGRRTGCFPLEGMREVVRRVEKGNRQRGVSREEGWVRWLEFESGHWLFWEEPERFNREVIEFVRFCVERA